VPVLTQAGQDLTLISHEHRFVAQKIFDDWPSLPMLMGAKVAGSGHHSLSSMRLLVFVATIPSLLLRAMFTSLLRWYFWKTRNHADESLILPPHLRENQAWLSVPTAMQPW
jgi:hypothetical protein